MFAPFLLAVAAQLLLLRVLVALGVGPLDRSTRTGGTAFLPVGRAGRRSLLAVSAMAAGALLPWRFAVAGAIGQIHNIRHRPTMQARRQRVEPDDADRARADIHAPALSRAHTF